MENQSLADRETVEEKADQILSAAAASNVAFLVAGDLFGGRRPYEQPRYMSINDTAIEQLLEVEDNRGESAYVEDTKCVGFARLGNEDQKTVSGKMKQLYFVDFGAPLHCLVIAGKTHPVEEEMLDIYKINKENDHGAVVTSYRTQDTYYLKQSSTRMKQN